MFEREYYVANCNRFSQFLTECPVAGSDLISLCSPATPEIQDFIHQSGLEQICEIVSLARQAGPTSAMSELTLDPNERYSLLRNEKVVQSDVFDYLSQSLRSYAPDSRGALPDGLSRGDRARGEEDWIYVDTPSTGNGRTRVYAESISREACLALTVLHGLSSSAKCVWLIHPLSRTLDPIPQVRAALLLSRARGCDLHTVGIIFVPDSHLSLDDLAKICTIKILSLEGYPLPDRAPYDNIEHFLEFGWPAFQERQSKAIPFFSKVLATTSIEHVIDIGCGSAEITLGLADKFPRVDFLGIDASSKQISRAIERKKPIHRATFEHACFEDHKSLLAENCTKTLMLLTGNVLPHLGALKLRDWLRAHRGCLPTYICFDFASNWRGLINQTSPANSCGPIYPSAVGRIKILSHMSTIVGPRYVERGMTMQLFDQPNSGPESYLGSQSVFTSQHADLPETYIGLLENMGYRVEAQGYYESGWGEHECFLAEYDGVNRMPEWPQPAEGEATVLNKIWYDVLTKLWRDGNYTTGSTFGSVTFFPSAVLPFDKNVAWARYIPRLESDSGETYAKLFDAWMQLVDRHTNDRQYPPEGSAKGESLPPYAPSLYDAVLGDIPASFIRSISDQPLRLALNDRDDILADLETEWLEQEESNQQLGFFVIPIYLFGAPSFCLISRGLPKDTPPSVVTTVLKHERTILQTKLEMSLREWGWREFVERAYKELKDWTALDMALKTIQTRRWKSWLDTVPGASLHDEPSVAASWSAFERDHSLLLNKLQRGTADQISDCLLDSRFFIGVKEGGCGHERFTALHAAACADVSREVSKVPSSELRKYALARLKQLQAASKGLPATDEGGQEVMRPDYGELNLVFHSFKALFCRSDVNRGSIYRLSPLMLLASRLIFAYSTFAPTLRQQRSPDTFIDSLHVRPKIASKSSWAVCENLWKLVQSAGANSMDISGSQSSGPDRSRIEVVISLGRARNLTETGGRGDATFLDEIESIARVEDRTPGRVSGLKLTFFTGEKQDEHEAAFEWIT